MLKKFPQGIWLVVFVLSFAVSIWVKDLFFSQNGPKEVNFALKYGLNKEEYDKFNKDNEFDRVDDSDMTFLKNWSENTNKDARFYAFRQAGLIKSGHRTQIFDIISKEFTDPDKGNRDSALINWAWANEPGLDEKIDQAESSNDPIIQEKAKTARQIEKITKGKK